MRGSRYGLAAIALVLAAGSAAAQDTPQDVLKSLNYQTGSIVLSDNLATIGLNDNFIYIDRSDTEKFLTKVWGNPPGAGRGSLGTLLPRKVNPLSAESFAVIVTYEATGYVSDEDAEKIDYVALMREMQQNTREASKERVAKGYEPYELLGWARQPYYDRQEKKLYWARRLRFGNSPDETLNYEIRILGRRGVLSMNVVAGLEALPQIDRVNPEILSMVSFNQGNQYREFNPNVDQVAAYGVAGLIAGGILTKAGFFKGLLVMLLASKKLLGVVIFSFFAALWGGLKALFARRQRPAN